MPKRTNTPFRGGFTLLELLIVIGIITLLVGVLLAVGLRAIRSQDERATKNVLISLDRALSEYILVAGSIPKFNPRAHEQVPGPDNTLGLDRPDASVFIRQVTGYGEVDAIIRGIPERFLITTITGPESDPVAGDTTPSVIDAWAVVDELWLAPFPVAAQQLVYYVHPENLIAQELFGQCVNGRPYFMSAGPDRKYGFRTEFPEISNSQQRLDAAFKALDDNIYSYTPGPAKKDSR